MRPNTSTRPVGVLNITASQHRRTSSVAVSLAPTANTSGGGGGGPRGELVGDMVAGDVGCARWDAEYIDRRTQQEQVCRVVLPLRRVAK